MVSPSDKDEPTKPDDAKKADEPKKEDEPGEDEPKKDDGPMRLVEGDLCGWKIYGFVYGSSIVNTTNGGNRYNGPWNISDQAGTYLNQAYLTLEKTMGDNFAVGGRVDGVFGNDYLPLQSRGWELRRNEVISPASEKWNTGADYGVTVPQLYAEAGTSKASVLVGHFYTPLGYEQSPAIGNFFNTHTYAFNFTVYPTQWGYAERSGTPTITGLSPPRSSTAGTPSIASRIVPASSAASSTRVATRSGR